MRSEVDTAGIAASIRSDDRAKSLAQEEPSSIWEELHPDKPCLLDDMTPEEIDEFKAAMQEVEEKERKHGRSSYCPQPEGMTLDDLVRRIKRKATKGETIAD